jgi:hypothetical protein
MRIRICFSSLPDVDSRQFFLHPINNDYAAGEYIWPGISASGCSVAAATHVSGYPCAQEELVETKEVIEAQIYEALLSGQYQQVLYEYVETQARLEFLAGVPSKAVSD